MTIAGLKPKPDPSHPWMDLGSGRPASPFADYIQTLDVLAKLLNVGVVGPLTNAANDAAAAAAGVPINGLYRTTNAVQIRLT